MAFVGESMQRDAIIDVLYLYRCDPLDGWQSASIFSTISLLSPATAFARSICADFSAKSFWSATDCAFHGVFGRFGPLGSPWV